RRQAERGQGARQRRVPPDLGDARAVEAIGADEMLLDGALATPRLPPPEQGHQHGVARLEEALGDQLAALEHVHDRFEHGQDGVQAGDRAAALRPQLAAVGDDVRGVDVADRRQATFTPSPARSADGVDPFRRHPPSMSLRLPNTAYRWPMAAARSWM